MRKTLSQASSLPDLGTMKISVVQPTRGLIFSEAQTSLEENLQGYDYRIYRSFNLTIPDCQNTLVEEALLDEPDFIFFHEEDVVLPDGAIDDLVMVKADIACIDYGVGGWGCVTRDQKTQEILWCGLGATLVKKEVFDGLEKPYFRSDKGLLLNDWPETRWVDTGAQAYGGQDIWFCMHARAKGFNIVQVGGEARHLKLEELGRAEINKGIHNIKDKERISRKQVL